MSASLALPPSLIERICRDLVGLKMPRALEALDQVVRRLEQGEIGALEAVDILLSDELTIRENSRIKTALRMGRLATIKTLAGYDFSFQPSLDRDRILTLAQLGFVALSSDIRNWTLCDVWNWTPFRQAVAVAAGDAAAFCRRPLRRFSRRR